jgi:hypothetical protein
MDPEDDLFKENLEGNLDNYEEDDDDDFSLNEDLTEDFFNKILDKKEEEEGGEEDEEGNNKLFPEEEEEEENNFDEKELESLNKKLGTNFKSVDELKNSFKKDEEKKEKESEEVEYKALTTKVNQFEKFIKMDNEDLVRQQLISQALNDKKDINSKDVNDEIDEKIEGLKDLGQLDVMADNLRTSLSALQKEAKSSIDKIDERKLQEQQKEAKANVESLQNAFVEILEKQEFMGVTVTKETINEVYKKVRSNNFFESVNKDQGMIAKLALFVHLEGEISKRAGQPTQSDSTKKAFDLLSGKGDKKARSVASARSSQSKGDMDNLLNFVK